MQSASQLLASLPTSEREAIIAGLTDADAEALMHDWRGFLARPDQVAPDGEWDIWAVIAGRGYGKTRTGAEWIKEEVESGRARRIALVAETAADARDVMIEGESGLLAIYADGKAPLYEPSKRRVTWANGAIATLYNATEPGQLRGPQHDTAWCDELAKWRYARETWDQLQFTMRLGDTPKTLITTTPRPIELVKAIIAGQEGRVVVTRGKTIDNAANLAAAFMDKIQKRYAGTRLGRQELNAEILGDMPGALWTLAGLDAYRRQSGIGRDALKRVLVAVDPAVTSTEDSDYHGIIVAAQTTDDDGVVLQDGSLKGTPLDWAKRAVALHDKWQADGVVVEVNQGGDMVAQTLRTVRPNINVIEVRATRGKHVRAEPIASLYEQGRVTHVGSFPELETQMTQMTTQGYQGEGSPDRVDALVWALAVMFPDITAPIETYDYNKASQGGTAGGWMGS